MVNHSLPKWCQLKSNKGGSLVLILVLTAALLVIGLGTVSAVTHSFRSAGFLEAKMNENAILGFLQIHLKNQESCESNFNSRTLDQKGSVAIATMEDLSKTKILSVGDIVGNRSLRVLAINLETSTPTWQAYQSVQSSVPAAGYSLDMSLAVTFEKTKDTVGSSRFTARLPVPVLVNSAAQIIGCVMPATPTLSISDICQQVGGVVNSSTGACDFSQDCTEVNSQKLASGQCVTEALARLEKVAAAAREAVDSASPSPTPTPGTTRPDGSTPTSAQLAAWEKYGPSIRGCLSRTSNGKVEAVGDAIECFANSATSFYKMAPDRFAYKGGAKVNSIDDPAIAGYIYEQTQLYFQNMISH